MDDMNAFERLVAERTQHHAGPVRPVDDAAILADAIAAAPTKQRIRLGVEPSMPAFAAIAVALAVGLALVLALGNRDPSLAPGAAPSAMPTPHPSMLPYDADGALRWEIAPLMTGVQIQAEIDDRSDSPTATGAVRRQGWDRLLQMTAASPDDVRLLVARAEATESERELGFYVAMQVQGVDADQLEAAVREMSDIAAADPDVAIVNQQLELGLEDDISGRPSTWLSVYVPDTERFEAGWVHVSGDTAYAVNLNSWWSFPVIERLP